MRAIRITGTFICSFSFYHHFNFSELARCPLDVADVMIFRLRFREHSFEAIRKFNYPELILADWFSIPLISVSFHSIK